MSLKDRDREDSQKREKKKKKKKKTNKKKKEKKKKSKKKKKKRKRRRKIKKRKKKKKKKKEKKEKKEKERKKEKKRKRRKTTKKINVWGGLDNQTTEWRKREEEKHILKRVPAKRRGRFSSGKIKSESAERIDKFNLATSLGSLFADPGAKGKNSTRVARREWNVYCSQSPAAALLIQKGEVPSPRKKGRASGEEKKKTLSKKPRRRDIWQRLGHWGEV